MNTNDPKRANQHSGRPATPLDWTGSAGESDYPTFDRFVGDRGHATALACLQQLKPLDRQTLLAFCVQGMAIEEMAHMSLATVGTIKRGLHYARERLKALLHRATRQ